MKRIKENLVLRILIVVILQLIVYSVIVCTIGYQGITRTLMDQYADGAFKTANSALEMINVDRIDALEESDGKTVEYNRTLMNMDKLCNSQEVTFIYMIQPDTSDYNHIKFLFSAMNSESNYNRFPFGYVRETTNDEYKENYKALYEKEIDQALVVRNEGYIETDPHITAMVAVRDSKGTTKAILCVQRQLDAVVEARHEFLNRVFFLLVFVAFLVIAVQWIYLDSTLLKPVKDITDEAIRFANENVKNSEKLGDVISNRDEIGHLAHSIDRMESQIHDYVEDLTLVTAKNQRIETELKLASMIQDSMLPGEYPAFPDRPEFDIYGSMDAAREVGGDFYDYFLIDEDHLYMVIADVSDKGVPAALFMMESKAILANQAMMGHSPADILENANNAICDNKMDMFVTAWVGILEISTGKVIAANAGHEYPVFKKTGGKFALIRDSHGLVLGGMPDMKYTNYEFKMDYGSKLFLYTDGLPEATDENWNMFGTKRLLEALNIAPDASTVTTIENIWRAVADFVGNEEQFDDLTMLCMKYLHK